MRLVTFERQGAPRPGVILGAEVLDVCAWAGGEPARTGLPADLQQILKAGAPALAHVRRLLDALDASPARRDEARDAGALVALAQTRLLAPLQSPGLILCEGLNYRAHLAEMGAAPPPSPSAFVKAAAAVVGPDDPIVLPASHPEMVDFQGELSAVIGAPCHDVGADQAMDFVVALTLVNDVSARDWAGGVQAASGGMPAVHAWDKNILGKQFPSFCPMGPALATLDEFADPNRVAFTTELNGVVMQRADTADLLFSLPQIIAHFSRFYALRPGDVITTGSPSGSGFGRNPKVFMKPGDVVTVHAPQIGALTNPVVAAAALEA